MMVLRYFYGRPMKGMAATRKMGWLSVRGRSGGRTRRGCTVITAVLLTSRRLINVHGASLTGQADDGLGPLTLCGVLNREYLILAR